MIDDLELELRKLPGVRATGFTERDDVLLVQIHVGEEDTEPGLPLQATRIAYRHSDRPVAVELVRWRTRGATRAPSSRQPPASAPPAAPQPQAQSAPPGPTTSGVTEPTTPTGAPQAPPPKYTQAPGAPPAASPATEPAPQPEPQAPAVPPFVAEPPPEPQPPSPPAPSSTPAPILEPEGPPVEAATSRAAPAPDLASVSPEPHEVIEVQPAAPLPSAPDQAGPEPQPAGSGPLPGDTIGQPPEGGERRSDADDEDRVRLLAVLTFPDTDELEVHLTLAARRTIGRAAASRGLLAAVEATLDALRGFVPGLAYEPAWARTLETSTGDGFLVAAGLMGTQTQTPRHGLASGASAIEAAARATLQALNRSIVFELATIRTAAGG
jgi:hypothetical protein